jgi:RHH-type proline utilization regulon transcriptional repressor/proline dehydrogenase/delta 1-pyrroline-5-carboxylate dehydrogenase
LRATARSRPALLEQIAAALASGNRLWVEQPQLWQPLAATLPSSISAWIDPTPEPPEGASACRAVLFDATEALAEPERLRAVRDELAASDGALVPLVLGGARGADTGAVTEGYDLLALISEQTISTNTAALGGDPALLDLAEVEQSADT